MLSAEEFYASLRKLKELRQKKKEAELVATNIQDEIDSLNGPLIEYFQAHDIPNQPLDESVFYISRSPKFSISDEGAFVQWMDQNDEWAMVMSFNANKFKSYYKSRREAGEQLPPGIKEYIVEQVRVRGGTNE